MSESDSAIDHGDPTLDEVIGSLEPLSNESADLDREIEQAVAVEAERRMQRMKRRAQSPTARCEPDDLM